MAWSDAARHEVYVRRYGEEEGEARYQAWQDKHAANEESQPQGGDIVGEKEPASQRATRTRSTRKPTVADKKDLQATISVVIASADKYVSHNIPAELWKPLTGTEEILDKYVGDAFGGNEVERLSGALADVLAGNKWLVAAMKRAQKTGGWVKLMAALVSVLGPRLVALGIIPNPFDMGGSSDGAPDMAGGGAYGGDRPDGGGEVRPDIFSPIADTSALRGAEEQGGFGEVPGSQNGSLSRRDARFAGFAPGVAPTAEPGDTAA
jgi:hypothetical protein